MKHFDEHSDDEMEDALSRADACFRSFGTLEERTAVLRKATALMLERREELARLITLEMEKLIPESRDEVDLNRRCGAIASRKLVEG